MAGIQVAYRPVKQTLENYPSVRDLSMMPSL